MFDLVDNRERLFGRAAEFTFLTQRAAASGLTAIVGRPQMGKSWTMVETARRLATDATAPTLVGIAEATGTTSDLLLRAVADLYERWLSQASYREQFQQVWAQQKDNVLPAVAKAVGGIVAELPVVGKAVGGLINQALNGLLAADKDLVSGRLVLPPLQYDTARDLVGVVATISKRPVALFLDDWQLAAGPAVLESFVKHRAAWPQCHMFLALTEDTAAEAPLRDLAASEAGAALVHPLPPMDLSLPGETQRMAAWLRQIIPATSGCDDATLAGLVDGYPGVIYRWSSNGQRQAMSTLADLQRLADDAQAYRFSELEGLLATLDKDARRLAIRLALVPLSASEDGWAALRLPLVDGLDEALLDDLALSRVLQTSDPPSFGHAKRAEAAREWFANKRPSQRRQEAERICLALGRSILDVSPSNYPRAAALRDLEGVASLPEFDPWSRALARAASTLFGTAVPTEPLLAPLPSAPPPAAAGVVLVAMGLGNGTHFARRAGDPARAAALLARLEALAHACPEQAEIARFLASALDNAMQDAREANDAAGEDAALARLRLLSQARPGDASVRTTLCQGLYNTLRHRDETGDSAAASHLLNELAGLAKASPGPETAEAFGRGLYQLGCVSKQGSPAERAGLQDKLLALAKTRQGQPWFDQVLAAQSKWFQPG